MLQAYSPGTFVLPGLYLQKNNLRGGEQIIDIFSRTIIISSVIKEAYPPREW